MASIRTVKTFSAISGEALIPIRPILKKSNMSYMKCKVQTVMFEMKKTYLNIFPTVGPRPPLIST